MKVGDLILDEDGDYGIVMGTEVNPDGEFARILFPSTMDGDTGIECTMNEWQIVKVLGQ
tara:strand:+ start:446 stop:622 length:177 start_codon:yes stop_codon:yes gene_type:complete